jgi:hypothetical protein
MCKIDVLESPTSFLVKQSKRRDMKKMEEEKAAKETPIEGEMFKKCGEMKLKKYWFSLLNKELYCELSPNVDFKRKDDYKHKGMYNLVGVFI